MPKINILKKIIFNGDIKNTSLYNFGIINFYIGVLFFSSALPVGLFFLLISMIISIYINKNNYLKEKWNIAFFITLILMLFSCLKNYLNSNYLDLDIERYLIWVDFLKWLIFFTIFSSFQTYLKTVEDRYRFAKIFVISLFPIILSCILQDWFKIFGPFNLFDNLIIWFQRPILTFDGRVTGLFNNPNYLGIWLAANFPFIILFIKKTKNFKKVSLYLLIFLNTYFLLKAGSRNAILSLIISLSFITPLKILLSMLVAIIFILIAAQFNLFPSSLFIETNLITNAKYFFMKIVDKNLLNFRYFLRLDLWRSAFDLILKKPIFGWGASTFSIIYQIQRKQGNLLWDPQHTHNMALEVAYNYGLIVFLLLSTIILFLFFSAYRKIFNNNKNYDGIFIDKIWFTAAFLLIFSQFGDITYFDGRISILIWILLSGLKCTFYEHHEKI